MESTTAVSALPAYLLLCILCCRCRLEQIGAEHRTKKDLPQDQFQFQEALSTLFVDVECPVQVYCVGALALVVVWLQLPVQAHLFISFQKFPERIPDKNYKAVPRSRE